MSVGDHWSSLMMKGSHGQTNQLHDINLGALALTPHASHVEVVGVWVVYLYGSSMWESGCWYVGVSLSPLTTTAVSLASHQSVSKAFLTLPLSLPPCFIASFFCARVAPSV